MTNVELKGIFDRYGKRLVSIRTNTASTLPVNRWLYGLPEDATVTKEKIEFFTIGEEDFFDAKVWIPNEHKYQHLIFRTSEIQHFVATDNETDLADTYLV